jgi:competence protein ComEC
MHPSQVLSAILGGFLLGIAAASFGIVPTSALWAFLGIAGALLTARRPRMLVAGLFVGAAVLGMWRLAQVRDAPSVVWQTSADRPAVTVIGYVEGDTTAVRLGVQYPFHVVRIGSTSVDDRLMIFGSDAMRPRWGQILELFGTLQQPHNSGDFDYVAYLAKNGIHGLMYFPRYSVPLDWSPSAGLRVRLAALGRLHRMRDALSGSVARAVSQPEAGYLAGILVGAQGNVSADTKDLFSRTGTSHILAISGYNITIIIGTLSALLAFLGRRRAFWLTTAAIAGFTLLVGASASVVRAAIMGVLVLAGRHIGRQAAPSRMLLLSAGLMCAYNPLWLRWDVGFQLSFLALAGILYAEPIIKPLLVRILRWQALASLTATTVAASILVLPLILFDFGQLALYTLPANILVLPLVPLAMALGLATGIAGLIWPLAGQFVGQSAWLTAHYQLAVIRLFAGLPHAAVPVRLSVAGLVISYAALGAWFLYAHRNVRPTPR